MSKTDSVESLLIFLKINASLSLICWQCDQEVRSEPGGLEEAEA